MTLQLISIIFGIIGAICWTIGDIYIVGFDVEKNQKKYAAFLDKLNIKKDKDLIVSQLESSTKRLEFGALIANFSTPCKLFSIYILYTISEHNIFVYIFLIIM